jgi:predicted dehydrogenase
MIARNLGRYDGSVVKSSTWRAVTGDFDAALIDLPNSLHGPTGIALVEASKHVFMERPLATTGAECRLMMAAANRSHVVLFVGFPCRYL